MIRSRSLARCCFLGVMVLSCEPQCEPPTEPDPSGLATRQVTAKPDTDGQVGAPGAVLPNALGVVVGWKETAGTFTPSADLELRWHVVQGGGSVSPATTKTDATGNSTGVVWTLGMEDVVQRVEVRTTGSSPDRLYEFTATARNPDFAVLELGQVIFNPGCGVKVADGIRVRPNDGETMIGDVTLELMTPEGITATLDEVVLRGPIGGQGKTVYIRARADQTLALGSYVGSVVARNFDRRRETPVTFVASAAACLLSLDVSAAAVTLVRAGPAGTVPVEIERSAPTGPIFFELLDETAGGPVGVQLLEAEPTPGNAARGEVRVRAFSTARLGEHVIALRARTTMGPYEIERTTPLRVLVTDAFVVSDETFAPGDWEVFQASSLRGGSHTFEQSAEGGNPPPFRLMRHHAPMSGEYNPDTHSYFPSSINVRHRFISPSGVYDPASMGRILKIDVAMDRRVIDSSPGSGGAVGHAFLLFQDGATYWADLGSFTSTTWERRERLSLADTDFVNGAGQNPDFSASGKPITFGYLRSNANTGQTADVELRHGIDNWRVTVYR
jgi:hypothetical protein